MTLNQALISETTLNATAANVTIPVPSGYTDLRLVVSARTTYASTVEGSTITFNGSNTYSTKYLQGDGSSAASGSQSILNGLLFTGANATANTFGNSELYIPNYSGTTQKSVSGDSVSENNSTQAFAGIFAGSSSLTSAITSITIAGNAGGSFVAGSSFTLYGISKLGVTPTQTPKATGGDIIKNDGTYWYHAFLSTGAFIPQQALSCDLLMVSGGGGGSNSGGIGAGGGGGALLYSENNSVTQNSVIPVTVGAGGARDNTSTGPGSAGSLSLFNSTSLSVANGAYGATGNGGNGGDSKNVILGVTTNYTGGTGTGPNGSRRGGSGAGTGANGSSSYPAVGGNGLNTYSSWATATSTGVSGYYGGGGGGGYEGNPGVGAIAGGAGGGGTGGGGTSVPNAGDGVANTGGGGGGCGGQAGIIGGLSGNGGSGIVIIRYPMA